MNNEQITDFVAQHQAKLREEFRAPDIDGFNQRSPIPLPLPLQTFFGLGERLYGSCFEIDCGTATQLCVQNFCPLNAAAIDASERNGWRFLDIASGCDGEDILISVGDNQSVFVGWSTFGEPPEDVGIAFADFLGGLTRLLGLKM